MPERRGYRPEKEPAGYRVPPELWAVILAAVASCSGGERQMAEPQVFPGEAQVEPLEKRQRHDYVYRLIKSEIDPKKEIAFEAILEEEELRHFQNKFSSPEDVRRNKRDYVFYTRKIESLFGSLKNEARRREIFELINKYCTEKGVPFELAVAVMANENAGRSQPTSRAGARGLFQVMPNTAKEMGVSESQMITLDGQVKAGVRALAAYKRKFGQWGVALAAYNGGSGDVSKFLIKHGFLPKENYLKSVTRNFGGNQDEFYTEVPDIVSMYEKSFDKQALGYPFRVMAMSRILHAIDWGKGDQPMKIDKSKLPHPELWDRKQSTETKSEDSGMKKSQRPRAGAKTVPGKKRLPPAPKQKILASTWKKHAR